MCSLIGDFVAGTRTPLYLASAPDRMRYVVADMAWQNLGAPLNVGMPIPNESPKMREGDGLMSQCPIHIADSGLVRFQIKSNDPLEAIRYAGVLNRVPTPSSAVSCRGGQSLAASGSEKTRRLSRERRPVRLSPSTNERTAAWIVILYMVEAVVTASEQNPQPVANCEMTIKR